MWTYYPDEGPLRRDLYSKHMEFFAAGAKFRQRGFIAANRIGKTEGVGGYEMTLHLTGLYPEWWIGRRFDRPTRWWAAGDTNETVRNIIQQKLLGLPGNFGTGLIPGDALHYTRAKSGGVPDAVESAAVRHVSGELSWLWLKSYEQGRQSFQGTELDGVWLDEEPPASIYAECLTRTMTTGGMMLCTFTPLEGLSDTVLMFLPGGRLPEAKSPFFVVMAGWDDVPHLGEAEKKELLASYPPYQRDARSKGIPSLGAGAIYPVSEDDVTVADFPIPEHWPRVYGLDVGWNRTAGVWLAWDRDADVLYAYSEHYLGDAEPVVQAQGIRGRGEWIPGVIDPAANGRSQTDGQRLIEIYRDLGLDLAKAENSVEAGIYAVWQRLAAGKLKIFKSCRNLLAELRLYRRDEKGRVVKEFDHACLHEDTLVLTGEGPRRIVELVGTNGWVMTFGGLMAPYTDARMTRQSAPTVRVELDDGQVVRCTPDHQFWTGEEWVEARDLLGLPVYNAVSQCIAGNLPWNTGLSRKRNRNFADLFTTAVVSISSGRASDFIGLCGKRIAVLYRRACTFTIRITTALTTRLRTWNSWLDRSMYRTTLRVKDALSRKLPEWLPPTGINLMLADAGTAHTTSGWGARYVELFNGSATAAVTTSRAEIRDETDFAPMPANRHGGGNRSSTTSLESANDVAQNSASTSTWARNSALGHARCVSVSESSPADVYCLTVPGYRAFAVEGGALVHNCDAMRYGIVSGLKRATTKPVDEELLPAAGSWMS